ncbi:hypothetical protein NHX12_013278 [Muraenolepis orangiensis]|uniref:Uncharacterized protein n=1 Tax=Muraenolepis orangiensis TaxID=630683 RepID=A0A9Q0I7X7_9TELE|nr:hypothetical protein NHX12_013278 [Muraenolepis orangiensis]
MYLLLSVMPAVLRMEEELAERAGVLLPSVGTRAEHQSCGSPSSVGLRHSRPELWFPLLGGAKAQQTRAVVPPPRWG